MTRIPAALAGLALVAVTTAACGSDDGSDTTASDPSSPSTSASSPSVSASDTPTESSSAVPSEAPSDDPVPSPVINKAVKAAIQDQFPALVPSGVPAGWTVVSAKYVAKGGGVWQIALTAPSGAAVTLVQSTASSADVIGRLLPDAVTAGSVKVSGTGKWDLYTGTGAAGLAKDLSGTGAAVVGPDQNTVLELADQLLTAEDSGNVDGG